MGSEEGETEIAAVEFKTTAADDPAPPECMFRQVNVSQWVASCTVEQTTSFCIVANAVSVEGGRSDGSTACLTIATTPPKWLELPTLEYNVSSGDLLLEWQKPEDDTVSTKPFEAQDPRSYRYHRSRTVAATQT